MLPWASCVHPRAACHVWMGSTSAHSLDAVVSGWLLLLRIVHLRGGVMTWSITLRHLLGPRLGWCLPGLPAPCTMCARTYNVCPTPAASLPHICASECACCHACVCVCSCQLVQHPEHPDLRYQLQLQLGAWLILQRYGLCCRICGHPHGHTHVHQWGHERSPDRMRG